MDNSVVTKLSAFTRVCQQFVAACQQESVDPVEAYHAIGRFLEISPQQLPQSGALTRSGLDEGFRLTQAQVEQAKKKAREEKAKRLGLTPSEVNLTSSEVKEAKDAMRRSLSIGGGSSSSGSSSNRIGGGPPPKSSKAKAEPTVNTTVPTVGPKQGTNMSTTSKQPVGVMLDPTGERQTAKTRLDNIRRLCLRGMPAAVADPTILHLVAYSNHYSRLRRQWDEYKGRFEPSGMLDPLRGLPDPWLHPHARLCMEEAVKGLREQPDSPGTYVLQADNGASFWDRDMPSKACPEHLRKPLPKEVYNELEIEANKSRGPEHY